MYDMTDVEQQRVDKFIERKYAETVELQQNNTEWLEKQSDITKGKVESGKPHFPFIDVGYSIIVTPTTVGPGYKVRYHYPGLEEELDVTDYDVW